MTSILFANLIINFDIQSTIYVIFVKIIDVVMKRRLLYILMLALASTAVLALTLALWEQS